MHERLEYRIPWAINPFVHNPYQDQFKNHGTHAHPARRTDPDSPNLGMMTVQQMHVTRDLVRRQSNPVVSKVEQLAQPKASYAELFYDLFFVASLTSFGIKHEITQEQAIASYVAFFTVLWWVWTSQMLYDVRFEVDDVIHRLFKFAQLILLGTSSLHPI